MYSSCQFLSKNNTIGLPEAGVGHDLVALNIQRGRDHGIPRYNALRVGMGLQPVTSINEISNNPTVRLALETAYDNNVDMIDAWIGGLAEDHVQGGMVGELFATIIKDQFQRLMVSDPFFYLNDPELTDRFQLLRDMQIIDLDRVKLSDILARNTNLPVSHNDNVMVAITRRPPHSIWEKLEPHLHEKIKHLKKEIREKQHAGEGN